QADPRMLHGLTMPGPWFVHQSIEEACSKHGETMDELRMRLKSESSGGQCGLLRTGSCHDNPRKDSANCSPQWCSPAALRRYWEGLTIFVEHPPVPMVTPPNGP